MPRRRLVSEKVKKVTLERVSSKLFELEAMEGTIYRILARCNKNQLSLMLGKHHLYVNNKIKNRSFKIHELAEIFRRIMEFKEGELKKAKIDNVMNYKVMTLKEFNKLYVGNKERERSKNGKTKVDGDAGSLEMEGGDRD